MGYPKSIANGASTDHPIPGLPFIEDNFLDFEHPENIEKIGRKSHKDGESQTWGRIDNAYYNTADPKKTVDGYRVFTTDANHTDYAWVIRIHPTLGKTVELVYDKDAARFHNDSMQHYGGYIYRHGGYTFDGHQWVRPYTVRDFIHGGYHTEAVPEAKTIYAADLLPQSPPAERTEKIYTLDEFIQGIEPNPGSWNLTHLLAWAKYRKNVPAAKPVTEAMVDFTAPEIQPTVMLGTNQVAQKWGMTPGALRTNLSRGVAPSPQSQDGKNQWSLPVVEHEAKRKQPGFELADNGKNATIYQQIADDLTVAISPTGIAGKLRKVFRAKPDVEQVQAVLNHYTLGLAHPNFLVDQEHMYGAYLFTDFQYRVRFLEEWERGSTSGLMTDNMTDAVRSLAEENPEAARGAIRNYMLQVRQYANNSKMDYLKNNYSMGNSREMMEQQEAKEKELIEAGRNFLLTVRDKELKHFIADALESR